jgi:hypothetical protein
MSLAELSLKRTEREKDAREYLPLALWRCARPPFSTPPWTPDLSITDAASRGAAVPPIPLPWGAMSVSCHVPSCDLPLWSLESTSEAVRSDGEVTLKRRMKSRFRRRSPVGSSFSRRMAMDDDVALCWPSASTSMIMTVCRLERTFDTGREAESNLTCMGRIRSGLRLIQCRVLGGGHEHNMPNRFLIWPYNIVCKSKVEA